VVNDCATGVHPEEAVEEYYALAREYQAELGRAPDPTKSMAQLVAEIDAADRGSGPVCAQWCDADTCYLRGCQRAGVDFQQPHSGKETTMDATGGRAPGPMGLNQAQREKEIPLALAKLERAITHAEGSLGALVDRVEPVLSPVPPTPVGEKAGIRPASTKLASMIHELAERVNRLAEHAASTTQRIEV
jgi:hypothetical protein